MAYSYVAKDGGGEDYTTLSEDLEKKVYFAGEVRTVFICLNILLGPVVRKVDSAIHRIVFFLTVVKMLEKL